MFDFTPFLIALVVGFIAFLTFLGQGNEIPML